MTTKEEERKIDLSYVLVFLFIGNFFVRVCCLFNLIFTKKTSPRPIAKTSSSLVLLVFLNSFSRAGNVAFNDILHACPFMGRTYEDGCAGANYQHALHVQKEQQRPCGKAIKLKQAVPLAGSNQTLHAHKPNAACTQKGMSNIGTCTECSVKKNLRNAHASGALCTRSSGGSGRRRYLLA